MLIWNIPIARNPFFLGREAELELIYKQLHPTQATAHVQPQAISGLGGIGKTQLVLEYAYRYHRNYQAVLWGHAESVDDLISSYVAIASLLRLPEHEAKEQNVIVQAVKTWLQTHQGWLLILDNADELAIVSDFLPSSPGGHVLLTTRATATGKLARRLGIETLPPEQGALFLLRRAGLLTPDVLLDQASVQERDFAQRISQELGGLPLALDQAGAYLEETGTDLAEYWTIYQEHRIVFLQERGGLVDDHPLPVATTWSLSFQRVEERNPAAAELLRLCAFLAPDAIAEEALTAGASSLGPILAPVAGDTFLLNQAIEALRAYSLIRRDSKEKMLSMHRLVQAVLQDRLEETERRTLAEQAVVAVNAAFPHVEHETWMQCERLLPQALAVARSIGQYQITSKEAGRLLYEMADYLTERARYTETEPLYQRALRILEQQVGLEHPEVAKALQGQARLYLYQGKYAEVEPLLQRALHIREQQFGSEHPDVAKTLHNLANLYSQQSKYAEAEPLYQRALRILERQLGPEHPLVAHSFNNLAILYYHQGKYAEAEPLFQQALHIWEQQLGPEHPDVANPLNALGVLYSRQEKYAEAEPLLQRALHIWEQQLGPEHPDVAHSLNNLANLYYQQGKYAEAEPLFQQALHIWEQHLVPGHHDLAFPFTGLANLYREQGKYAEAESLFQRALRIREQHFGLEHPYVAESLTELANLYWRQGKYAEAESLFQRALHIQEQWLGAEHLNVAEPLIGLANLYREQGKYVEAESLFQRALHIREQWSGTEHPKVARSLADLADLYRLQGKVEQAESLYQRALVISASEYGEQHFFTQKIQKICEELLQTPGNTLESTKQKAAGQEGYDDPDVTVVTPRE